MSVITIRLVTCSDLVSRTIRQGECGFWASHCEALTPDGFLLGAHADGGVQKRAANYDVGKWTLESLVEVPCSPEQQAAFYGFLEEQVGKPYDFQAIIAIARGALDGMASLNDSTTALPSFICSALIVAGLITCELIKSAPSTIRSTTPRDIAQMLSVLAAIPVPNPPAGTGVKNYIGAFDPFHE